MEFHNYRVSGPQWKALIDASGDNIQWLLDLGVKFAMVSSPGKGKKPGMFMMVSEMLFSINISCPKLKNWG